MGIRSLIKTFSTIGKGTVVGIPDATETSDPMTLFGAWFEAAGQSGLLLPESMTLATVSETGRPSARMVLLKDFGPNGFVFYTNYGSRKAEELDRNPNAALLLHWAVLQRQIRVEGTVERISQEVSRAYFQTRARGSQIGAWASHQSDVVDSRRVLEEQVERYENKFRGGDIPIPEFWGGYRLVPEVIEFWQGRLNRLHDRILFRKEGEEWVSSRLCP